jgi:(4-(4-[2-(gamma-L-glutamylamino)ethyl]phenoxymethyl)furan-2-yl)methanamine synthase
MQARIIGWDIGGAHVKAAAIDASGKLLAAQQWACPLWQGIEHLELAIDQVLNAFGRAPRHAVTMTGEMADLFADRATGVTSILASLQAQLGGAEILLYAGECGFVAPGAARENAAQVASANWHATAKLVSTKLAAALVIDIGSTTTDIVPITAQRVSNAAANDSERLACDELVYTGVVRTPLFALAKRAPFAGQWVATMAEYFATTADVHRLTRNLPAHADQQPSADHQDKSELASARRLARMVGRDVEDAPLQRWRELAGWFAEQQRRHIENAALRILSRDDLPSDAPLVGAGVGRFLAQQLAQRLGRRYLEFHALVAAPPFASDHAPAVSVALLDQF